MEQSARFGRLLDALASDRPAPGGGSAAAAVVAVAAALLEKVAAVSEPHWDGAGDARHRAHELRLRSEELLEADEHAYLAYLAALRSREGIDAARSHTIDVPLEIVRTAAGVVAIARELASNAKSSVRPDASAAAILAQGALSAAARLVQVNLGAGAEDPRAEDPRLDEALAAIRSAGLPPPPE